MLGIGITGIGSGAVLKYDLSQAVEIAIATNDYYAKQIGINPAARVTCIKPSGTTSLVLGSASGIHAWHWYFYLRTMRFNKHEDLALHLMIHHPEIVEDDILRPHDTICVRIPVKAPVGSIMRTETALDTLERVKKFSIEWIKPGHKNGDNTHNVSATISIDKDRMYTLLDNETGYYDLNEWQVVGEWMWKNKEFYNGLSVLPYDGGSYIQAPFENITEEQYNELYSKLDFVDLTKVVETEDYVNFGQVAACAGGACEIN